VQRAFLSVLGTASSGCPALLVCPLLAPEVTQNNDNNNNNNSNDNNSITNDNNNNNDDDITDNNTNNNNNNHNLQAFQVITHVLKLPIWLSLDQQKMHSTNAQNILKSLSAECMTTVQLPQSSS